MLAGLSPRCIPHCGRSASPLAPASWREDSNLFFNTKKTVDILIEISIYSAVITAFLLLFRAAFKKRISPKVQYA
ncbi:MAG: hypothetical protein IJA26_00635, partial [Clostridia bacterium]|nr:hypothetical protein [Clostridia bacterium]